MPVDWPFGGKRGVETADNEMDVCRHVCGRIFEGEDDDVRVEGSTVFFFFTPRRMREFVDSSGGGGLTRPVKRVIHGVGGVGRHLIVAAG